MNERKFQTQQVILIEKTDQKVVWLYDFLTFLKIMASL